MACINKFGEYDEMTGMYMKPTLPTTIGTALKYLIHLRIVDCISSGDREAKQKAEDLQQLLKTCLPAHVNKNALESLLQLKRQKPINLPSTEDIKTMNKLVNARRKEYLKKLVSNGFDLNDWNKLSKYTLVSILIFNRRRPGELERTYIKDLESSKYR